MLNKAILFMTSIHPQNSQILYNALGFLWNKMTINSNIYYVARIHNIIAVLPFKTSSLPKTELYFYDKDNISIGCINDNDCERNRVCDYILMHINEINYTNVSRGAKLIPIIRTAILEETMSKYQNLGHWIKEKHDNGPVHYCLETKDLILEIYPNRISKKNADISIEFVIDGIEIKDVAELPTQPIKNSDTMYQFIDPDDRIVTVFKPKILDNAQSNYADSHGVSEANEAAMPPGSLGPGA